MHAEFYNAESDVDLAYQMHVAMHSPDTRRADIKSIIVVWDSGPRATPRRVECYDTENPATDAKPFLTLHPTL